MLVEDLTPAERRDLLRRRKAPPGTQLVEVLPREYFRIMRLRHHESPTKMAEVLNVYRQDVGVAEDKTVALGFLEAYWRQKLAVR